MPAHGESLAHWALRNAARRSLLSTGNGALAQPAAVAAEVITSDAKGDVLGSPAALQGPDLVDIQDDKVSVNLTHLLSSVSVIDSSDETDENKEYPART